MNKFAEWVKSNDKKQRGVAAKLNISTSTLHDILRNGLMPSIKVADAIEQYTGGAITLYDWVDQLKAMEAINIKKTRAIPKKINTK